MACSEIWLAVSACLLWPERQHGSLQTRSVEQVQRLVRLDLVGIVCQLELSEAAEILMLRHEGPVAGQAPLQISGILLHHF